MFVYPVVNRFSVNYIGWVNSVARYLSLFAYIEGTTPVGIAVLASNLMPKSLLSEI